MNLPISLRCIKSYNFYLLQVARGDLNIAKYACFTVFHRWSGGKSAILKIHDSHQMMTITHPYSGEIEIITKKDPPEAHRALVWMMKTDCKSTAQFLVLLIPQVRPAHKYPISPWGMNHPPGGDNAVCM
jgi:hypothetical protein